LQSFYETDAFYETATQQLSDSLKTYIHQNKKLTKRKKLAYSNFIRVFNKLYKFKDLMNKRNRQTTIKKIIPKLKDDISQFNLIREKKWLSNKIKILENG